MKGIQAGSKGVATYDQLRKTNLIPELTQAACTIVGALNPATADDKLL
jgi:hypothetical protein